MASADPQQPHIIRRVPDLWRQVDAASSPFLGLGRGWGVGKHKVSHEGHAARRTRPGAHAEESVGALGGNLQRSMTVNRNSVRAGVEPIAHGRRAASFPTTSSPPNHPHFDTSFAKS